MAAKKILMLVGDYVEDYDTAYPALKPDIEMAGGSWHEVAETFANAHTHGMLVTAPAWPAHPEWMRQFLDVLGSRIEP
jgi:protease I